MSEQAHAVGEWAVIESWRYRVELITKVTASMVFTDDGIRVRRSASKSVRFSGTEKEARDLASVLTGLELRRSKAKRLIETQHEEAVEKAVQKALRATPSKSGGK